MLTYTKKTYKLGNFYKHFFLFLFNHIQIINFVNKTK